MCRMSVQTYCNILLSMCVAMWVCISCNIYVALGTRGLKNDVLPISGKYPTLS